MSVEYYLLRSLDSQDWPALNAVVQDANADSALSDIQRALVRNCARNRIAVLNTLTAVNQTPRWS